MIIPGLVSVTFRSLNVATVAGLAANAGLRGIEWGADVHVPAGDLGAARRAHAVSESAGLQITSYGSYFRAGDDTSTFLPVLRTAVALEAPTIRIWAGRLGSAQADPAHRRTVAASLASVADLAAARGVALSLEYHPDTLTDTAASTLHLLNTAASLRTGGPPVGTYYQTGRDTTAKDATATVRALHDHLRHIHVFSHDAAGRRQPLAARADLWPAVLAELASHGRDYHAQLEFVHADDPASLRQDAACLLAWLSQLNATGEVRTC